MLLDRYEFHDLYAVLVAFRSNPQAEYNIEITKAIISVLEKHLQPRDQFPLFVPAAFRCIQP